MADGSRARSVPTASLRRCPTQASRHVINLRALHLLPAQPIRVSPKYSSSSGSYAVAQHNSVTIRTLRLIAAVSFGRFHASPAAPRERPFALPVVSIESAFLKLSSAPVFQWRILRNQWKQGCDTARENVYIADRNLAGRQPTAAISLISGRRGRCPRCAS